MPAIHQTTEIPHVCANPSCGRTYMAHPFKVYCTTHCKKVMERLRRNEREANIQQSFSTTPQGANTNCLGTKANPTVEWLNEIAETLPRERFYWLTGIIPVVDKTMIGTCYVGQNSKGMWTITNVE